MREKKRERGRRQIRVSDACLFFFSLSLYFELLVGVMIMYECVGYFFFFFFFVVSVNNDDVGNGYVQVCSSELRFKLIVTRCV